MKRSFRLEYWIEDGWYVGKLKAVPKELEDNFN
jgi:hypothetical protein